MSAPRLGFLLLSLGLLLPQLRGADASPIAGIGAPRAIALSEAPTNSSNGENAASKSRSQIRKAIVESFVYDPAARTKVPEQFSPVLMHPLTTEPDLVVMPQFEVRARAFERGLPEAIAHWKDPRPQNHSRFGTGIHEKDFGKVRAGVVTILYIPVLINFSW